MESCGNHWDRTGITNDRNAAHVGCIECIQIIRATIETMPAFRSDDDDARQATSHNEEESN